MLAKLAFVMQRLKKYLKNVLSWSTKMRGGGAIFGFNGGHSCYEGDIELMEGPSTWENPAQNGSF